MTAPGLYCAICNTLLVPGGDTVRLQEWNEWAQLTFRGHSHAEDRTPPPLRKTLAAMVLVLAAGLVAARQAVA